MLKDTKTHKVRFFSFVLSSKMKKKMKEMYDFTSATKEFSAL